MSVSEVEAPAGQAGGEDYGRLADRMIQEIRRNCVLVYVECHGYEGRIQTGDGQVLVDGVEVAADGRWVTKMSWKYLPPDWQTPFNRLEGRAKRLIATHHGRMFKKGVYMLPRARAADALEAINPLKEEYAQAGRDKAATHQDAVLKFRDYLEEKFGAEKTVVMWPALRAAIPADDQVARKYWMEVGVWPIGGDDLTARAAITELAEAWAEYRETDNEGPVFLRINEIVERLQQEAGVGAGVEVTADALEANLAAARETTARMIRETVASAFDGPRRELEEAVDALLKDVNDGGRMHAGRVDRVRRCWDQLESWSWLAPPELAERLRRAAADVARVTSRDLTAGSALGARMVGHLQSVREGLKEAEDDCRFIDV